MNKATVNQSAFIFKCNEVEVQLGWHLITHISQYGEEAVIYTESKSYRTFIPLRHLATQLPKDIFFQIHQSHIVSLKYIAGYQNRRLEVNNTYLPVSMKYKALLIEILGEIVNCSYQFYEVAALETYSER